MTLGIYGDSFGFKSQHNNHKFWVKIVAEKLNADYKNYCESSSSLFYSYNLFLKTHNQQKKNIFLITFPYRYTKPITLKITGNKNHHISGPHNVTLLKKTYTDLSNAELDMLTLHEYWFMLMDEEFYKTAQELLVNDILNKRPDTIIIPCFSESLTLQQLNDIGLSRDENLNQLVDLQCRSLGKKRDWSTYDDNREILNGHLTPELNEILGQLVYNRIINGSWDRFPTTQIKHEFSWDTYYKKL